MIITFSPDKSARDAAWLEGQELPQVCTMEVSADEMTVEQRQFLLDYDGAGVRTGRLRIGNLYLDHDERRGRPIIRSGDTIPLWPRRNESGLSFFSRWHDYIVNLNARLVRLMNSEPANREAANGEPVFADDPFADQ